MGYWSKGVAKAKTLVSKALSWLGSGGGSTSGGSGRYSTSDKLQWLEVFHTNSRVRGPVNRIAEDVAGVKFGLRKRTGVSEDGRQLSLQVHTHRALDLLRRPNPYHTWTQFCKTGICYLELNGVFAAWIDREQDNGKSYSQDPLRLWLLRPSDVLRMPRADRPYWEIRLRGKKKKVRLQDMLWITYPNLLDPYGFGEGAAAAIAEEVAQDGYAGKWNSNFFRKGAHVGKFIAVPGLEGKNRDAFKAEFMARTSGIDNAHEPFVCGSGQGTPVISDLGPSHKDLDFVEGKRFLRDVMSQNWTVPPELLGIVENSNRSTIDASVNIHQRINIAPRVKFIEEQLNQQIIGLYGDPSLYLEFDNPVQETMDFILNQTTKGLASGTVMGNEWRTRNGFSPVNNWDRFFVPLNVQQVDSTGEPIGPPVGARPETPPDELMTDEELAKSLNFMGLDSETENSLIKILRAPGHPDKEQARHLIKVFKKMDEEKKRDS